MCGIAGAIADATASEAEVRSMIGALRRRGPDGQGIWIGDGATLGHARLAVIDLSEAGDQPMISADGRYVIVFNGEIYNAEVLRERLNTEGPMLAWRGHSDTEVLLEWIARHGLLSALESAAGMFALGVWDRRERRLLLARDRAGEKPIYYGWAGSKMVFASELKAFRSLEFFDPTVDPAGEAAFAHLGHVPAPLSIYRDARKLQAGSWLTWTPDDGRCWPDVHRWWSVEAVAESGAADQISNQDVADAAIEQTLGRAVRRQMVADVPLGAFLSGGIDSSLVVALMQSHSHRPVKTFTIAFDGAAFDESECAAAVARHLGTDHHSLLVSGDEARAVLPMLPAMYDEPFADASQIPTALMAAFARQQVTVALSGDGGDESFGGYNRYRLLPTIHKRFGHWPAPLRTALGVGLRHVPPGIVTWIGLRARVSAVATNRLIDLATMLSSADRPPALYDAAIGIWPSQTTETDDVQVNDFVEWMMIRDFEGYLSDGVLTKVDRATMYHSLESRCPYLDPDVIELAWRIPSSTKLVRGRGKLPLRRILSRYVPQALIDRPKAGFTPPVGDWIRGALRDWADHLLSPERLVGQSAFDPTRVRLLWQKHRAFQADYSRYLWPVLMFSAWRAHWLD